MTESENENDHFDLDHFDHFFATKRVIWSFVIGQNRKRTVGAGMGENMWVQIWTDISSHNSA